MPFEQIPYTNFHGTNQDWMIQQIKQMIADWASYRENLDAAWEAYQENINNWRQALDAAFTELHTYVHDYFDNLDVQQEINNKLDQMAEDGTLDQLLLPYFNEYKTEINNIITTQNNTLNSQNNRISLLESEMDAFLQSHPATTGEKDAELVDIRVGYNGKIYPTAGDAVRDQISDIYNEITEPYNLFNPEATYTQTNNTGEARNGYTIKSDGSVDCTRTIGVYGSLFLVDESRNLEPGTYTVSGKFTSTMETNVDNRMAVALGRTNDHKTVYLTTERGGKNRITIGEATGYFRYTFTLSASETFAIMFMPYANADGTHAGNISEILITKGAELLPYSPSMYTALDIIARKSINETQETLNGITEPYNLWYPNDIYTQTNKDGAAKSGYTILGDGSVNCIHSIGNYGQLFLVNEYRTLEPGTYTISGKLTSTLETPNANRMAVALGRTINYGTIYLTTTRGGDIRMPIGEAVGYFVHTVTITDPEPFAVMFEPYGNADTNHPANISEILITKGSKLLPFSTSEVTAVDQIARTSMLTENMIFNGEPYSGTFNWNPAVTEYCALFKNASVVESFAFFTDPHVGGFADSNRNTTRLENYFKRIQKTYRATPCSFIMCGGDFLNNSTTMDEACYRLGNLKGILKNMLDDGKLMIGNHDTNYQGKLDSESDNYTGRLSNAALAAILFRDTNTKKAYYSFDGANSKCYVLDSGIEHNVMGAYDWEQVAWLANELVTDDPDHAIIFLHIIKNAGEIQLNTSNFAAVVEAYNNHSTVTLNEATYDFTACTGHIDIWIGGHTHEDETGTLAGIPYVITGTNSYNSDTPIIDLVLMDYTNHKAELVRVGNVGTNRTITI